MAPEMGAAPRVPVASWLALAAAGVALVLTAVTSAGTDPGAFAGGVLAFVVPYVVIAAALAAPRVWTRGVGVALAALMTWLPSSGIQELLGSLARGATPRPMAVTFVALTAIGLAVVAFGLRDLLRMVRITHYWAHTPPASRTAFLAVCYLALLFVMDTYASTNPSLPRMLMVPALMLANFAAAFMLRAPSRAAQAAGVFLTAAAGAGTVGYWVARPEYFTLVERSTSTGNFGYTTMLPWPVLLALVLAIEAAIVSMGVYRLVRGGAGPESSFRD
jgi:hypothetical protein